MDSKISRNDMDNCGFADKRNCENIVTRYSASNNESKSSQQHCWDAIKRKNYVFEADMGGETPFREWKMPRRDDHVEFVTKTAKKYIIGLANELGGCIYFGLDERQDAGKKPIDCKHVQGIRVSTEDQTKIENSIRNYFQKEVQCLGRASCPTTNDYCPFHLVWFKVVDGQTSEHKSDLWVLEIHVFPVKHNMQTVLFLEPPGSVPVTYYYPRQEIVKTKDRCDCLNYLKESIESMKNICTEDHLKELEQHFDCLNSGQATRSPNVDVTANVDALLSTIPSCVDTTLKRIFCEDQTHSRSPLILITRGLTSGDEHLEGIRKKLCQIPWSLVLDADHASKQSGLLWTANNSGTTRHFEWYRYKDLPTKVLASDVTYWVSILGCEDDQNSEYPVITDLESYSKHRQSIRDFFKTFKSAFKTSEEQLIVCVIRLCNDVPLFNKITDDAIENIGSNEVVVFSANGPAYDDLKDLYRSKFISFPLVTNDAGQSPVWQLNQVLDYYASDTVRKEQDQIFVSGAGKNENICIVPALVKCLKAGKVTIVQHASKNAKRYQLTSEERLRHQTDFYMGKAVTFESLYCKHEIDRDSIFHDFTVTVGPDNPWTTNKMCSELADKIADRSATGFYWIQICHESGAGGTTLARKLLYSLAEQYPCIMLENLSGGDEDAMLTSAVSTIIVFRRHLKNQGQEVLCLLVEDNIKTAKAILDKVAEIRSTASFVLITTERNTENYWAKKDKSQKAADSRSHLPLFLRSGLSANEKSDALAILKRIAPKDDNLKQLKQLPEDGDTWLPFWLLGLCCFAEDYTRIKQVVSDCLKDANMSPFEKDVLKFVSLIKKYADLQVPWSLFKLFKRTFRQNDAFSYYKEVSFQTRQLLLYYPKNSAISVAHSKLADEILRQLKANNSSSWLLQLVEEFFRDTFDIQTRDLYTTDIDLGQMITISEALLGITSRREERNDFGRLLNEIEAFNVHLWKNLTTDLFRAVRKCVDNFTANDGNDDYNMLQFKCSLVIHEALFLEKKCNDFDNAKRLLESFVPTLKSNDLESIKVAKVKLHNTWGDILRREVFFKHKTFDKHLKDSNVGIERYPAEDEHYQKFEKNITDLWLQSVGHHREATNTDPADLYALCGEALAHLTYMQTIKQFKFREGKAAVDLELFVLWLKDVPNFPDRSGQRDIFTRTLNLWETCERCADLSRTEDDRRKLLEIIGKKQPQTYKLVGNINTAILLLQNQLDIPERALAYVDCFLSVERVKCTLANEAECRKLIKLLWPLARSTEMPNVKGASIQHILRLMPHISVQLGEKDNDISQIAFNDETIKQVLVDWVAVAPDFERGDANFCKAMYDFDGLVQQIPDFGSRHDVTKDAWNESVHLASNRIDRDRSVWYFGKKSGAQRFVYYKDIYLPHVSSESNNECNEFIHYFDHEAEHWLMRLTGQVEFAHNKTGYLFWRGKKIYFYPYALASLWKKGTEVWFFLNFSRGGPKAEGVVPKILCDNSGRLDPIKVMKHLGEKCIRQWGSGPSYSPIDSSCHLGRCAEPLHQYDQIGAYGPQSPTNLHENKTPLEQPQYCQWKDANTLPPDKQKLLETLKEHLMRCTESRAALTELADFLKKIENQQVKNLLNDKLDDLNNAALHFVIDRHVGEKDLLPTIELLLINGASPDRKNGSQKTPYQLLAPNEYFETKQRLLKSASSANIPERNTQPKTPNLYVQSTPEPQQKNKAPSTSTTSRPVSPKATKVYVGNLPTSMEFHEFFVEIYPTVFEAAGSDFALYRRSVWEYCFLDFPDVAKAQAACNRLNGLKIASSILVANLKESRGKFAAKSQFATSGGYTFSLNYPSSIIRVDNVDGSISNDAIQQLFPGHLEFWRDYPTAYFRFDDPSTAASIMSRQQGASVCNSELVICYVNKK